MQKNPREREGAIADLSRAQAPHARADSESPGEQSLSPIAHQAFLYVVKHISVEKLRGSVGVAASGSLRAHIASSAVASTKGRVTRNTNLAYKLLERRGPSISHLLSPEGYQVVEDI